MEQRKIRNERRKGNNPARGPGKLTQKKLINLLNKEGAELMKVFVGVPKIPKPIHTMFRTRQMVGNLANSTGLFTGTGTQTLAIVQGGTTVLYGQMAFEIGDLDQLSSFAAVFDQYRIDKVCIVVRSTNPAYSTFTTTTVNAGVPSVFMVFDRDDGTAPSTLASLREYDNCVEFQGEQSLYLELEPSVTPSIFAVGSFSGYGVQRTGMWLDMANTSIPHYGVKFAVTALNASTTADWVWQLEVFYFTSFRNVR